MARLGVCVVVGMLYTMCFGAFGAGCVTASCRSEVLLWASVFHNVHNEIIMCSCYADDQAVFPPSVIREHTCILRKCMDACVSVCVCVYT